MNYACNQAKSICLKSSEACVACKAERRAGLAHVGSHLGLLPSPPRRESTTELNRPGSAL